MSDEIIKIGRKNVRLDDFKSAVANAKFYRDVCRELGFKEGSTLTIKKSIDRYGINASHLEQRYPITEEVMRSRKDNQRVFDLSDENKKYFTAFQGLTPNQESWNTYKATVGGFLESLGDKDFGTVTIDEILSFVQGSKDRASHLRSLVSYVAHNNVNNYFDKVSKEILLWIASPLQQPNILNSDPIFPDEIEPSSATLIEGSITSILVNKYERDRNARRQCLDEYGTKCSVCEKKMSDTYGEIFSEKIHVHHLTPMSKYDEEHEIDPIKELRPVCPNCHMIIHCRKDKPYSIEEVKAFML